VSVLRKVSCETLDDVYPTRPVPKAWLRRVQNAMGRPLFNYQVEGAGWICSQVSIKQGALLGDDVGLGKTAQAVAAICALRSFPVVIVCPLSLMSHWQRELSLARDAPALFTVRGRRGPLGPGQVFVMNYALLWPREKQLEQLNPKLFVFDEAQELRNPTARGKHRAAVATRLVRRTPGALLLTGTPVMNRPAEMWRLLHLTSPKKWPLFADYKRRYLGGVKGKEVGRNVRTTAGKVERLDDLQAAIAPFMLRRLKHQVLPDLPPKSRRSILVQLGQNELAHYRAAERDVVKWLHTIGQGERAVRAARAKSLVQLTLLRRIAAMGKLTSAVPEYLGQWFSRVAPEPLVIFAYHREIILGLWNICRKLGVRVVGIGGKEKPEKRQRQVDIFQKGLADVFVAPIASAGVGLNLQRASEALFLERIWTPMGMIQAEDRIHRLGQTRPCTITYLDAQDTVDEHIANVLHQKQRLISATIDNGIITDPLGALDDVAKRLLDDDPDG